MSATDWDLFERHREPSWKPWLDVSSSNTLFEQATSAAPKPQKTVCYVLSEVGGLSFDNLRSRYFVGSRPAGSQDDIVQWVAHQVMQDFDQSPISDFREQQIEEARCAATAMADDGHQLIAARIDELIDLANAEWPDTEIPSSQAIHTLRRLLRRLGNTATPNITLTSSGQLWIQWAAANGQVAVIIGAEGVPAIAALLPDRGSVGRAAHFNFYGSEEKVAAQLVSDPALKALLA